MVGEEPASIFLAAPIAGTPSEGTKAPLHELRLMAGQPEWFKRLADVPGVGYRPPAGVRKAPGHDAKPRFSRYNWAGENVVTTWWKVGDFEGSASPAQLHRIGDMKGRPISEILQGLYETLELPGLAADYHFAIQACTSFLWGRRHDEPFALESLIDLDLLDIRLLEARPSALTDEFPKGPQTYFVAEAFSRLVGIYTREGMIREALDIATRAIRFQQPLEVAALEECLQACLNESS